MSEEKIAFIITVGVYITCIGFITYFSIGIRKMKKVTKQFKNILKDKDINIHN